MGMLAVEANGAPHLIAAIGRVIGWGVGAREHTEWAAKGV